MTMVVRATSVTMLREVRMPRGAAARDVTQAARAGEVIEDGSRHRAIGSVQALGLAIVASVLVTGLLYAAL